MTISPERLRGLRSRYGLLSSAVGLETYFALCELEQARTTLEGVAKGTHVIVPRAVTADMTEAGYRAYYETPAGISCDPFLLHRFAAVWSAMLAPEKEPAQENRATNLCDGSVCSCGWCPALMEAEKSAKQGGEADMSEAHGMNYGHGHVFPRPDGAKARCGGPGICSVCAKEAERAKAATSPTESGTPRVDALLKADNEGDDDIAYANWVSFARQLERELAEKQAEVEASKRLCEIYFDMAVEAHGEADVRRMRDQILDAALAGKQP